MAHGFLRVNTSCGHILNTTIVAQFYHVPYVNDPSDQLDSLSSTRYPCLPCLRHLPPWVPWELFPLLALSAHVTLYLEPNEKCCLWWLQIAVIASSFWRNKWGETQGVVDLGISVSVFLEPSLDSLFLRLPHIKDYWPSSTSNRVTSTQWVMTKVRFFHNRFSCLSSCLLSCRMILQGLGSYLRKPGFLM